MDPQLEILLELQDLQAQKRALREEALRQVEEDVFELSAEEALAVLDGKVEELAGELAESVGRRWRTLVGSVERPVVPVINGICYGCFVAVPTAWSSEASRNDRITVCEHCGRFLYYLD